MYCPLLLSYSECSSIVYQIVLGHRSANLCLQCDLRVLQAEKLPPVVLWIHEIPLDIHGLWNLLGCNYLRSHFRVATPSFLVARHGCCHKSFQSYHRIFESFFVNLVIRINEVNSSQSPSIVEFLASRFSIIVLLDSERLYQSWSIPLARHDLVL